MHNKNNSGHYNSAKRKEQANTLRLLPLVPADGVPPEPSTDRPYSITVISTTPGIKPCVVGITGAFVSAWGWLVVGWLLSR